jgi:hypothetical protein
MKIKIKRKDSGLAKIWLIIFIIMMMGVVVGEVIYLWQEKSNNSEVADLNTSKEEESKPEPKIVLNCGSIFPDIDKTQSKEIMDCMDENYENCKAAKITFEINTGNGKIITYFEIIGLKEDLCQVKIKYPQYAPNPEWEDLEMICSFDKNKEFKQIVYEKLDLSKCEGELAEVMK